MAKKSKAQLKRLQKRAADRGEAYTEGPSLLALDKEGDNDEKVSAIVATNHNNNDHDRLSPSSSQERYVDVSAALSPGLKVSKEDESKRKAAAERLQQALKEIEANDALRAKDRRSAKRQAEALALEASGMPAQNLLVWYQKHQVQSPKPVREQRNETNLQKRKNPYIAFVGQLSYETTKDGLYAYLLKELGESVTSDSVKIRLLTKDGKSRGMAFVETSTPELLYSCLSLHHTYLDGRRINVERSVGGSNPAKRQSKLEKIRQEQQSHLKEVIEGIFEQHGLQFVQGLDDGVRVLCQKHAPSVVQAALERFVETNGLDKEKPSAYLTFLLDKLGKEGILKERSRTPDESRKKRKTSHPYPWTK